MSENKNRYPENIMKRLRQRLDLEPNDKSRDVELNTNSPREAFSECCEWEGFIGWSDTILAWIDACFDIPVSTSYDLKGDIYREVLRQHRMDDAKRQMTDYLEQEDKMEILDELNDSDYSILAHRFGQEYDCNVTENDTWQFLVKQYLEEGGYLDV